MALDWNDLRYFLAVARAGTVSEAARRLAVDHSTVIRRIDALERALGAKLFERTLRGYGLTQSGLRLLGPAETMGGEAERAQSEIGSAGEAAGTVRISSLEGFGNFFLARHLPAFARAHPRIRIELMTIQQIVALSRREADIAITVNPPESTRIAREVLVDYTLFVYGSAAYLAAHPPIRTREDLRDHAFAGYIDDLIFTRGLDYLGEVLPGLKPSLQSSSLHAQLAFARDGYGLCVLPAFMARAEPGLIAVLPGEVRIGRSYWLVEPAPSEAPLAARIAARFIRDTVRAHAAEF